MSFNDHSTSFKASNVNGVKAPINSGDPYLTDKVVVTPKEKLKSESPLART